MIINGQTAILPAIDGLNPYCRLCFGAVVNGSNVKMKKKFPFIKPNVLESVCKIVGNTLSSSDIDKYLGDCGLVNVSPEQVKWKKLYNAFVEYQNKTQESNGILRFIQNSIHPSRFINNKEFFESNRSELNKVLSFIELQYAENGKFRPVKKSNTISEAERRATSLIRKLEDQSVHPDVLKFCKAELLVCNYFHAVFEATKSVADKIRDLSGQISDGSDLVDSTFSVKNPILIINNLMTETEKSEQKGFSNLLKGFFGMFRNTVAHSPKVKWVINEQDALDIMTIASLCHRKLDNAQRIR